MVRRVLGDHEYQSQEFFVEMVRGVLADHEH